MHCKPAHIGLVALFLILAACSFRTEPQFEVVGNTFDPWSEGRGVTPENAPLYNVSYWYNLDDSQPFQTVDGSPGKAWLFLDKLNAKPRRGVIIHWSANGNDGLRGQPDPRGRFTLVNNGMRVFAAYEYCLSPESVRHVPVSVYHYGLWAVSKGMAESGQLYVKRYIPRILEGDGSRIDIAYIEDIGIEGHRCSELANFTSEGPKMRNLMQQLTNNADQSFDVVN
ncbi:MAG: hypothetical protein AAF352_05435 [Pseudomonadota bacterium]